MLSYVGHIERKPETNLVRIVMHSEVEGGQRCSGKQEVSFRNVLARNLKCFNIDPRTLQKQCLDRSAWRNLLFEGAKIYKSNCLKIRLEASVKRKEKRAMLLIERGMGVIPPADIPPPRC